MTHKHDRFINFSSNCDGKVVAPEDHEQTRFVLEMPVQRADERVQQLGHQLALGDYQAREVLVD